MIQRAFVAATLVTVAVLAACVGKTPATSPGTTAPPRATSGPTAAPGSATTGPGDAVRLPIARDIPPGSYFISEGLGVPARISFAVPAGWNASGFALGKYPDDSLREMGWGVSTVDDVFADPCGGDAKLESSGTADALAQALRALPGVDVAHKESQIEGRSWQTLNLTVSEEVDTSRCDPPIGLQLWQDLSGNYFIIDHGSVARVHVVEVDNERLVLISHYKPTSPAADIAELDRMIASIRFETVRQ